MILHVALPVNHLYPHPMLTSILELVMIKVYQLVTIEGDISYKRCRPLSFLIKNTMAQRRMFSLKIVSSDAFLDMPISTQALYFHLGMYADDDGFINPKKVIRMVGGSDDDLKILIAKRFVITFENGVIVIKHWKINNLIRKDFYQPTVYSEERKKLCTKDNGGYTDNKDSLQIVNKMSPQVRLGKVSIGKDISTNVDLEATKKVNKKLEEVKQQLIQSKTI